MFKIILSNYSLYSSSCCFCSEVMKEKVKQNVHNAFYAEEARTRTFGTSHQLFPDPPEKIEVERPQPSIFVGSLKHYQLKGMNWLANLYDQVNFIFF